VRRVSDVAGAISNLTLDTVEQLQVSQQQVTDKQHRRTNN